jgi:uncharacterized protein (UPF0332 family)
LKAKKDHPPKKKHANKPRPVPAIPLSDIERADRARLEFAKALIHLDEAERLAKWSEAPNACVHAAYYAMNHCASAAVLAGGGIGKSRDAPKSHASLVEHFGKLVENEPGTLGECGRILSRALTDRLTSDYGLIHSVSAKDAAETAADARKLVDACRSKWKSALIDPP